MESQRIEVCIQKKTLNEMSPGDLFESNGELCLRMRTDGGSAYVILRTGHLCQWVSVPSGFHGRVVEHHHFTYWYKKPEAE